MEMVQLNDLLPPEQWESYWTILGDQHEEVVNHKEYVIFEHYCSTPSCDCYTLTAAIHEIGADGEPVGKPVAIIDYDWSSTKTSCHPTLHDESPKTKTALGLLAVYTKHIHRDEYVERIKSHYARVKALALEKRHARTHTPKKKISRNDPCLCGSNKKYKKCCLNK